MQLFTRTADVKDATTLYQIAQDGMRAALRVESILDALLAAVLLIWARCAEECRDEVGSRFGLK